MNEAILTLMVGRRRRALLLRRSRRRVGLHRAARSGGTVKAGYRGDHTAYEHPRFKPGMAALSPTRLF